MPVMRFFEKRRGLLAFVYLFGGPLAILTVAIIGLIRTNDLAGQGREAHSALCSIRTDFQQRVDRDNRRLSQTRLFFKQHPHVFAGVPPALIQKSLADDAVSVHNEQQTLDALAGIHCR